MYVNNWHRFEEEEEWTWATSAAPLELSVVAGEDGFTPKEDVKWVR
ncbi:MAG: hypothetical protein ACI8T1_002916 [Verrucomicrobiales bacterium]|jgi:hypothetical protein